MSTSTPILRPTSLEELRTAIAAESMTIVAGGTDVMVLANYGRWSPKRVVCVRHVPDLKVVDITDRKVLSLGAGVTFATIATSSQLRRSYPALVESSLTVGSPQVRTMATVGGNVATASPAGDALPVLHALGAEIVVICGSGQERTIPIGEFVTGPKQTSLGDNEVIVAVRCPTRPGLPQTFMKVGPRNAMSIAIASVGAVLNTDLRQVQVAFGSVGPTVVVPQGANDLLADGFDWEGLTIPDGLEAAYLDAVGRAVSPITDHRASAAYRSHAARTLAGRALRRVVADAIRQRRGSKG